MSRPFFFGGSQQSQQSQYLVQMKAGKMIRDGNMVKPVKDKKGLVFLHQSSDDNLMHFCWKDRTSGKCEDDLIIFPDDAEFLKVPQCTTGRVFVLKFKASPRRLFFWSQEPKDDKDDEIVSKINEYINNPMAATRNSNQAGRNLMSSSDLGSDEDFRNLFNSNFNAQQLISMLENGSLAMVPSGTDRLVSLLGSVSNAGSNSSSGSNSGNRQSSQVSTPVAPQTPSTTPALAPSSTASDTSSNSGGGGSGTPGLRLADLQNIISGYQNRNADSSVDLHTSINMDSLRPLLSNENFMNKVSEMLPQYPSELPISKTPLTERFTSTVQSPQFQQALNMFTHALQSGQLGPLMQQFGLSEECVKAANNGDLESFVKALETKKQSSSTVSKDEKKTDKTDKKDDDEDMCLD